MVLEHLHGGYVIGADIVSGYSVMPFHKIESFDIKILYGFALI